MKRKINFLTLAKIIAHLKFLPVIIFEVKNWPAFLFNYIGLRDGKFACIFRDGIKIKVEDNIGVASIAVIFIKKDYEGYGQIKNNSVVVDIGANIGIYSVFAAKESGNIVYALEPMPDNFKLLQENIKTSKLENKIIPFNFAVAVKKEKRILYLGGFLFHSLYPVQECPFNASYKVSDSMEQNYIDIDCITLEDIFLDNKIEECDMLKMDCEGAEFEILYNLKDQYFKKIKNIRMEYHNFETKKGYNGRDLADYLKNKGFEIEKFKKITPFEGFLWMSKA